MNEKQGQKEGELVFNVKESLKVMGDNGKFHKKIVEQPCDLIDRLTAENKKLKMANMCNDALFKNTVKRLQVDLADANEKIEKRNKAITEVIWAHGKTYETIVCRIKLALGSDFAEIIKEKKDETQRNS